MRILRIYFTLVLISLMPHLVEAQVERNLIDCSNCIWAPTLDGIFLWKLDWQRRFAPVNANVGRKDLSMTIGKIKAGDTIYKTYLIHHLTGGLRYWDGREWRYRSLGNYSGVVIGIGAHDRDFYYVTNDQGIARIYYFNGGWSEEIDITFDLRSADIAVDAKGRGWVCAGEEYAVADHFRVIDKDGRTVKEYPIAQPFSARNIYGITIERDIVYVGIGPDGDPYPSRILAFKIEGGKAQLIEMMPQVDMQKRFYDLASGEPGVPGQSPDEDNPFDIYAYPNPTTGLFRVVSGIPARISLEIFDLRGRLLLSTTLNSGDEIDISHLPTAAYMYHASVYGEQHSGRLLKF